ncbi:hypothetical protein PARU111607_17865 [Palleronia rufa]
MLLAVPGDALGADPLQIGPERRRVQRRRGEGMKRLLRQHRLGLARGQERQHRLAHPGAIGRTDPPGGREHLDPRARADLVHIEHLPAVELRQMHHLPGPRRQRVHMRPRHRRQRRRGPGGMRQPHQPHPQPVLPGVGIVRQQPLAGENLQQPVERGLGIAPLCQQLGEPHRPAVGGHAVQHVQRLAYGAVPCSHVRTPLPADPRRHVGC